MNEIKPDCCPNHGMTMADTIRKRLFDMGVSFRANENISQYISEAELNKLQEEVEEAFEGVLYALVIDTVNDHNTKETAKRLAKMYIREVMAGRYQPAPKITEFPNVTKLDELYVTGPITIRSMCSHHFVPIMGQVWVGVLPGDRLIGLSKFNRIADWINSRPQIQEEAIMQLADYIEDQIKPAGLAVVMKAEHMCVKWRGCKDHSNMTNAVIRGVLAKNPAAKEEFYNLIRGMGY